MHINAYLTDKPLNTKPWNKTHNENFSKLKKLWLLDKYTLLGLARECHLTQVEETVEWLMFRGIENENLIQQFGVAIFTKSRCKGCSEKIDFSTYRGAEHEKKGWTLS